MLKRHFLGTISPLRHTNYWNLLQNGSAYSRCIFVCVGFFEAQCLPWIDLVASSNVVLFQFSNELECSQLASTEWFHIYYTFDLLWVLIVSLLTKGVLFRLMCTDIHRSSISITSSPDWAAVYANPFTISHCQDLDDALSHFSFFLFTLPWLVPELGPLGCLPKNMIGIEPCMTNHWCNYLPMMIFISGAVFLNFF